MSAQSGMRRLIVLLLTLGFVGALVPIDASRVSASGALDPAAAAAASPDTAGTASFTWSMRERFGLDTNNDHLIDLIDTPAEAPLANPDSWSIDFDACEADGQPRPGATYSWTFGSEAPTAPSTDCRITHEYEQVDVAHEVTLTVVDAAGTATTTQTIVPRDYVIVVMGDSAASGEGNPDWLDVDWTRGGKEAVFAPKWNNEQCHRSALSGQAQAALRLEQRDPHSSVTFIHVGCSGARITRGVLSPYQGIIPGKDHQRLDCDDPNLANPYKPGETFYIKFPDPDLDAPNPQAEGCLPSQIDQVDAILDDDRQIDAISIVAGINDLFFSKPVMACLIEDDCSTARSSQLLDPKGRIQTGNEFLAPRLAQLQDRYALMFQTVMDRFEFREPNPELGIAEGHVFLAEYPNSGQNPDGTPCHTNELELSRKFPKPVQDKIKSLLEGMSTATRAGEFSATEWAWATANVLEPLNAAGQTAIAAANARWPGRFSIVEGTTHAFDTHGYCAQDTWMQNVVTSFLYQRDPEGSFHPNRAGHFFGFALPLESALAAQLGVTAPALPPTVPGDIETLEAIDQSMAPFLQVMGRTNIIEQLDRIFPIQPGLPSKKSTDWLGILKSAATFVGTKIGDAAAQRGLSEVDLFLDDIDQVNGPENDGQIGDVIIDVSGEISPHSMASQYELVVRIRAHGPASSLNWSMGGLSLSGEGSEIDIDTTVTYILEPGRDDQYRAYLPVGQNDGITLRLTAQQEMAAGEALTAQLGPIDVVAHGPAGGKAIDIDTGLTLSLTDPDEDGKITIDELTGASFDSLFDVSCTEGSHVDVDVALGAGLPGLAGDIARLQIHDANVCDGINPPSLTFTEPNYAALADMGTNEVLDIARALAAALERLQAAGNISLPFTDAQLDKALDLVAQLKAIADDPEAAAQTSLQQLVAKVEQELGLAPGALNLRFDAGTSRFLFDLDVDVAGEATVPVDLGVLADAGLLGTQSTGTVSAAAGASLDLGVAFDITPDPEGTDTEHLRSVSDRLLISTDSRATFDATASVQAQATAQVGLVPVELTLDNGSGSAQNLIVKRDASRPLASVEVDGPGQWVSLAALLSGDASRASVSASLNAALNPTTITARATIGGEELASGHVTVRWNDLGQLDGPDGPTVEADADYGAAIARFAEAANDPIELLKLILSGVRDSAAAAAAVARTNEQLARSLPLIGKGYDDVVAGFDAVAKAADDLQRLHTKLTLPQLELALETALAQALGIDPAAVADKISLGLDRSTPRTALTLHVDLCQASAVSAACASARPVQGSFSFDANGLGIVGTSGQTTLALDYLARLRIDLALELPFVNLPDATHDAPYIPAGEAPAGIYVLGSTGIEVDLGVHADGSLKAYVGPFAASLGMSGTKDGQPYSDPAVVDARIAFDVSSGGPADERLTPAAWLAKVEQNLAERGVTRPVTTSCAPDTIEGCATIPVYFKTAAGDITAPDGSKWVKLGTEPITFTAGQLLQPATYDANVPQSILDDLQNRAFSITSLITAIQYVLEQAQESLDGKTIGQQLPIVGDAYAAGSSLINDLNALLAKLNELAARIDAANTAGNARTQIRSWLFTNLGPSSSLKLLLDGPDADTTVTAADVQVVVMCGEVECIDSAPLLDITDVKLVMSIGKTSSAAAPAIDFGVKGMQIRSDAPASASVGWHLDLALGVDATGVYVDPVGVGNRPELGLSVDASLPTVFDATIFGLPIAVSDKHVGPDADIDLGVDLLGDQRLRLPDLFSRGDNPHDRGAFGFTVKGCADLEVGFEVTAPGLASPDALPSILGDMDFHADWNGCPGTPGGGRDLRDGLSPTASFAMKNVRLDVGKLASRYVGRVLRDIQRVTSPVQPVINTIQQPIPVVSDLARLAGKGQVTWLDAWAAGQRASGNDVTAVLTIVRLLDWVNKYNAASAPNVTIPIADDFDIDLAQAQTVFADPDEAFDKLIAGTPVVKDVMGELSAAGWNIQSDIDRVADESKGAQFTFPALEKPSLLLQMLFGKDVDLALFDAGTLRAENGFDFYYGLDFAKVGIRGDASITGHLALSYDTAGIRRVLASKPLKWSSLGALVHGFGINDLDQKGEDVPEIRLEASLALYAYAGVPGANIRAEGGVEGFLQADLIDPDGDGKLRYEEIKGRISNPRCLFDTTGSIDVFARLKGELGPFSGTKDIVHPYTLWEFNSIESWCQQMESGSGGGMPVPPPVLAQLNPQNQRELLINVGSRANLRNLGGSIDETVTVTDLGDGRVTVAMLGVEQTYGSTEANRGLTSITFNSGPGNDKLFVNGPAGPGDTLIRFVVNAGAGDDVIYGGNANDSLLGEAGNDTIVARGGQDTVNGGDGNDTLDGGADRDTISGDQAGSAGAGDDTIDGGEGDDLIYPMSGADYVTGGLGNDNIQGNTNLMSGVAGGPDFLIGGEGKDTILGSNDGDIIIGNVNPTSSVGQQDYLWGQGGDDCIIADNGTAEFVEVDGQLVCRVTGVFEDTINESDYAYGGLGSDTIFGGPGNDWLSGDNESNQDTGNDVIDGGPGNDTLHGAGGDDTLIGNVGDDRLEGERGNDRHLGGPGNDVIYAGEGDDEALGGDGDDIIWGLAGNDTVIGDAGDDEVDGYASSSSSTTALQDDDVVEGGEGNDEVLGGPGSDRVSGGPGDDVIAAHAGNDTVLGGPGTDKLDGGPGDDLMRGGDGDDRLVGQAGRDHLAGDAGNDVLVGDSAQIGNLTPATYPSGAQRVAPAFNLNIANADTYDGGSGDDFIYDVDLTPETETTRQSLRVRLTDPADHGSLVGTVVQYVYTPAAGYKGSDQASIELYFDGGPALNTGRIIVSNGENHAPVANDDQFTTDRGVSVQGNVLANDTDPDGDQLSVVASSGTTSGGSYSVNAAGGFLYTPSSSSTVTSDSFTYTVRDGDGATDVGTVTVSIRSDVTRPVVTCDQPTGWSATEWTITCTAADNGSGLADPSQASFELMSDLGDGHEGPALVDPPAVCDKQGNCTDLADFEVFVDRKPPLITSANDGQTYALGAAAVRQVSCSDGGSGLAEPCEGDGLPLDTSTVGLHSFIVTAVDAVGNRAATIVTYTVEGEPNGGPVAVDDEVATDQNVPVSGNVLDNDSDPEGDALTVVAAAGSTPGGAYTLAADGAFTYTPELAFGGPTDGFTYTVRDTAGATATGRVTITVRPDAVAPVVECEQPTGWSADEWTVRCTAVDVQTALADAAQSTFQLVSDVGAGNEGTALIDPPAVCDIAGNCTDLEGFTVQVDRKPPTITSANDGQSYVSGTAVTRQVTCTDDGSGLAAPCEGDGSALDTSTPGTHTFVVTATDNVGNQADKTVSYMVVAPADTTAPSVSCDTPSGWSATNVTVSCVATDSGSGFGGSPTKTVTLTTGVAAGVEGPATLDPAPICDDAGNCTDLPPFTVLVDRKPPTVGSANDGATYRSSQTGLTKDVSCADGGSGLADATCPQHGQPLDMTPGTHSFTVTVVDKVGNATTRTFTYTVVADSGVKVSVEDVSVKEGNGPRTTVRVPVRLSVAATTEVTVKYSVVAGTANSTDAVVPVTGSVVFTPDRKTGRTPTVQYIDVTILGDKTLEPDETLEVWITASGATVARGTATVTILNDDKKDR